MGFLGRLVLSAGICTWVATAFGIYLPIWRLQHLGLMPMLLEGIICMDTRILAIS